MTLLQQRLNISIMKRHFENLAARAARAIKHWWLLMLAGVLVVAAGICVFAFPIESYVALSVLFGVLMLVVGTIQLIIASTSGNYLMLRGYIIVGGVLDVLLGIFLCVYPGVSLFLLPVLMGLWLMYHSFMVIALGGDMSTFRVPGDAIVTVGGILLLLLSIFVLVDPLSVGVATVLAVAGVGLIFLGVIMCSLSLTLRSIGKEETV